jgi:flagellar motor component MotA
MFDITNDKQSSSRPEWYMSEMLLSLGMVGTVIGFIYMLSTMFTDINVQDINSVQYALGQMATGMGTALWTTLTGLICSILLKLQLVYMDEFVKYEK